MDGWQCTDVDTVDIRQPLPWPDDSAIKCYASHVIEHVSGPECMRFLKEVYRILAKDGLVRLVVPEVSTKLPREHIFDLCVNHGHLHTLGEENLKAMLYAAGFEQERIFVVARDTAIDEHWKTIGESKDLVESLHIEAIK
jgi:ubiquinone/menaquinone biosynthesis C-methylase UbiE